MALSRWDPFGLVWPRHWPEHWRRWFDLEAEREKWLRVEELEEDNTLVVRVEIPDIDPDKDVEVQVTDGMLHISAKREERTEHKGKSSYRSEFSYGEFSRNIPLPSGIDKEEVRAQYKDGILEVRIPWPKVEIEKPSTTKVPISRG
ncbi:MAG: Hsp20/alpha crystallin family protein [Acidimicrobiales bacterium]|jgi:HSP20 family protein